MKLDYKKTIKVGFAFAIVMIFWSAYDFVVPLLLERAFGLSNSMRGLIMGLDNFLSLFLLPIFGRFSDKTKTRYGKRTPYIFFGTIATVILMVFVPISANAQLQDANELRHDLTENMTDEQWGYIYENHADLMYLQKDANDISKEKFIDIGTTGIIEIESEGMFNKTYYMDGEIISEEEAKPYLEQNTNYQKFCVAPLNIWLSEQVNEQITQQNTMRLVIYMIILFFVLVCMATFRSPAVALMPDVTPKPLRSPANAIINLMGGIGSAMAFLIYTTGFFIADDPYIGVFACIGGGMLLLLTCYMLFVKENKFVRECEVICAEYGINNDEDAIIQEEQTEEDKRLRRSKQISFFLILAGIFMWFMGYNAIVSNLSVYTTRTLNLEPSTASIISGAGMAIAAIAFLPVGYLATKIGRKKSVILGFSFSVVSFLLIWLWVRPSDYAQFLFAGFYLIAGFGLIIANVNTFPMVVELARAQDVGKYTGYYYMSTMAAQAITPFIAGVVMDLFGDVSLFAYSAFSVIIALTCMLFVKHGDSRPVKKSKMEMLGEQDAD